MATVMLSDKLVQSIIWNIQRPLETKAAELTERASQMMSSHADFVWDAYTKPDQAALFAANQDYMRLSNEINITIRGQGQTHIVRGKLSASRPVTYAMVTQSGLQYRPAFPEYNEIIDLLIEACTLRKEAKELEPQMKELCSRCGSLADLIKIFPSVQNYLDHETKERLARKVERKKNKPKELPEDLAGSLVKSRIFQTAGH
jgi:hypothetical protein